MLRRSVPMTRDEIFRRGPNPWWHSILRWLLVASLVLSIPACELQAAEVEIEHCVHGECSYGRGLLFADGGPRWSVAWGERSVTCSSEICRGDATWVGPGSTEGCDVWAGSHASGRGSATLYCPGKKPETVHWRPVGQQAAPLLVRDYDRDLGPLRAF